MDTPARPATAATDLVDADGQPTETARGQDGDSYQYLYAKALDEVRATKADCTLDPRMDQERLDLADDLAHDIGRRWGLGAAAGGFLTPVAASLSVTVGAGGADYLSATAAGSIVGLVGGVVGLIFGTCFGEWRAPRHRAVRALEAGTQGTTKRRWIENLSTSQTGAIGYTNRALNELGRLDISDDLRAVTVEARARLNDLITEAETLHQVELGQSLRSHQVTDELQELAASCSALLMLTRERVALTLAYDTIPRTPRTLSAALGTASELIEAENAAVRVALGDTR